MAFPAPPGSFPTKDEMADFLESYAAHFELPVRTGVKVELTNGKMSITSQSADVGEAREVIPLDYAGDNLSIGFNAQYVLEFLGVVGTDEVSFEFKDEQSPALLRPAGDGPADYKYVVMPMRLL
jgi:DNA polymerase-3 subunit beta